MRSYQQVSCLFDAVRSHPQRVSVRVNKGFPLPPATRREITIGLQVLPTLSHSSGAWRHKLSSLPPEGAGLAKGPIRARMSVRQGRQEIGFGEGGLPLSPFF